MRDARLLGRDGCPRVVAPYTGSSMRRRARNWHRVRRGDVPSFRRPEVPEISVLNGLRHEERVRIHAAAAFTIVLGAGIFPIGAHTHH